MRTSKCLKKRKLWLVELNQEKKYKEVHTTFVVDKAKALSMMGKHEQRVSHQASELAWLTLVTRSAIHIISLRETIEEGSKLDVLRELGGYGKALEKMGKALRKWIKRRVRSLK